jgi:hypothetical protein
MAVLFDPADEYVRCVLDRAKIHGEISLADLEAIVEAGIEAKGSIPPDDIADTIDALADMGIEIDDGLTEEQRDDEFLESMHNWVADGNTFPELTGEGWLSLARAHAREKAGHTPTAEDAAMRREILSKRTFIQNVFAHLGPRLRSERRG